MQIYILITAYCMHKLQLELEEAMYKPKRALDNYKGPRLSSKLSCGLLNHGQLLGLRGRL